MKDLSPAAVKARKVAVIIAVLAGISLLLFKFYASASKVHSPQYSENPAKQEMFWKAVEEKDVKTIRSFLQEKDFHPLLRAHNCAPGAICNLISYAAQEGATEIVKILHEAGSPVDEHDGGTGDTPIMRALLSGYVGTAEYLAEAGADPLGTNQFGVPAFIIASGQGSPRLLELMIKAGAPVDFRQAMPGMIGRTEGKVVEGITPLMVAAANGRLDLVETLLKHGADPSLKDEAGFDMFAYAKAGKNPGIETRLMEMVKTSGHKN